MSEPSERKPWFTEDEVDYYAEFLAGPTDQSQRNFRTLLATVSEVLGETDLDALLNKLVLHAVRSTHAERGMLLLKGDSGLEVRVALDAAGNDLGTAPSMSRTIPEEVLREGKPVTLQVTGDHEVLDMSLSSYTLRLRQLMCAPLRARGKPFGVIYVDSKAEPGARSDQELKLFHAQAGLIGMAIENHRLFREAWEMRDVQRQLEVARDIQRRLFPKSPAVLGETEFAGLSTISAQVGGDYFDYLTLDAGRVGLAIGDVSGHGIAPALMMSDVRGHLRSLLQSRGALDGVYGVLNQVLGAELAEGMYVALFFAVYHPGQNYLEFQNAGHAAPLLYRPETGEFREIRPNAPALGLFSDFSAGLCPRIETAPGDLLVCCTDGVLDRPDHGGELYGMERLREAVRHAAGTGADPAAIAEAVKADCDEFAQGRPARDDFTLLVARL